MRLVQTCPGRSPVPVGRKNGWGLLDDQIPITNCQLQHRGFCIYKAKILGGDGLGEEQKCF